MNGIWKTTAAVALSMGVTAAGCASGTDTKPETTHHSNDDEAELGSVAEAVVACGNNTTCTAAQAGSCCDEGPAISCTDSDPACGRWPSGIVHYTWDTAPPAGNTTPTAAQKVMFRQAMDDWEKAAKYVVRFVENAAQVPTVKISYGSGSGAGYNGCAATPAACKMGATEVNVYHELGHSFLNIHNWQRNDGRHYQALRDQPTICGENRHVSSPDVRDFGPFDFKSTMNYAASYPAHTRYDGSPVCANNCSINGAMCAGIDPCPGGSCVSCLSCRRSQPFGLPTGNDGAAVIELYRNLAEPQWKRFRRTVNESNVGVNANQPYDYSLAPGVSVSAVDPTPALAAWPGASPQLAVHVLGSDKHIYGKATPLNSINWSGWTDLGCCFNSAPSAVSWAANRTDVVARGEDNAVYINTFNSGAWTGWQSLGGSAGSAPAITSWGTNRLDVFVKSSANNSLLVKSCTANCLGSSGTWTSWQAAFPNGALLGKPAVVSRGAGLIDIFVHGEDHRLYGNWYHNGVAGSWYQVKSDILQFDASKPDLYAPAVASRGLEYLEIFARGVTTPDNKISVTTWQNGPWSAWVPVGGHIASAPATVSKWRDTNRADLAAMMTEETTFNGLIAPGIWWKERRP